ncbi:MAG: SIS domain-containing protein [Aggregatilineales bacterium]
MMSLSAYFNQLHTALQSILPADMDASLALLERAYDTDQTIFAAGNGQSATTADAFALDLTKQTVGQSDVRRFRVISLSANGAAVTAWANDTNYDSIFVEQLRSHFRRGDVLIVFSASGNSPNVVAAAEWIREHDGYVIALTGFNGGKLRELADVCVHVDVADYGHAETAHIAITHYWVDYFKQKFISVQGT